MLALASHDGFESVRGVIETLLAALRLDARIKFVATDRYADLDSGAAAEILLDEEPIGMIGLATRQAAEAFGLDDPPTVAELLYSRLVEAADLVPAAKPLPQFPGITRDLALVVDERIAWAQIQEAVLAARVAELESVDPVSVYRGKQIPAGKKSVALRMVLRSKTDTLKSQQADEMTARVLKSLETSVGAQLRA